jgi:coenzyme PQQ precursor peptide PqqA
MRSAFPWCVLSALSEGTKTMEWTTPKFEEIALNCEINSYASAAL